MNKKIKKYFCVMLVSCIIFGTNASKFQSEVFAEDNRESNVEVIEISDEILTYYLGVEEGLLFKVESKEGITEFYKYNNLIYQKLENQLIIVNKIDNRAISENKLQSRSSWSSYTSMSPVLINMNYTTSPATATALAASVIGVWPGLLTTFGQAIVDSLNSPKYVYMSYSIATYSGCSILTSKTNVKLFKALYDGSNWIRSSQVGNTITAKSYFWTGDPSNYGYPAACRSLTGSYPYQSGAM
ncbi:MAG: hypothetical protein RR623_08910 [Bacilli bacterium]